MCNVAFIATSGDLFIAEKPTAVGSDFLKTLKRNIIKCDLVFRRKFKNF
jgi:hypothetical protein